MIKYFTLIVTITFLLSSSFCFTQQKEEDKLLLPDIIENIEKEYPLTFNYSNKIIENISITKPKDGLLIEELLYFLERESNLSFTIINKNQVVISPLTFEKKINFLDEILINNILTKGISIQTGGKTVIKPNDLEILPGLTHPDVLQSLQSLPGINTVNEKISDINTRGGTNDQNLFLWNGIKMYQTGHFFGLISPFNPYLINDVVVLKNGTSAKYGDGVSSIIEMNNKKSNGGKSQNGFGFNLLSVDAHSKIPLSNKTEIQFSARRSITDVFKSPTYNNYFDRIFQDTDLINRNNEISYENENFYFYDLSTTIYHKISKNQNLQIHFLKFNNNLKYDKKDSQISTENFAPNNLLQNTFAISTDYSNIINKNFKIEAQLFYSKYKQASSVSNLLSNNNIQTLKQENNVSENGLKLHSNYFINNSLELFSGYQFNETGITNSEDVSTPFFTRNIKNVIRAHSIFNELNFNKEKFKGKIGLRVNYFEKFSKFKFEPRVSINYKFLNNLSLEFLGELKSQTTSQIIDLQNDFLGVENRRWILSDGTTKPIISSQQVSSKLHYKKNGFFTSLDVYYKNVDGISSRSQGFQNQYQFKDTIGTNEVSGLEFLIYKKFNKFKSWVSYSYNKNNLSLDGLNSDKKFPSNKDITHVGSLNLSYTNKRLKLAIGGNWHSGKPFTRINELDQINESTNSINYAAPNSSNLPNYLRIDLSAKYTFKFNGEIGLSIWNLFDKKNVINSYYIIDQNNSIQKIDKHGLGLTPNISYRMKF